MSKENKLAQVFHFNLQGKREFKYDFLNKNSLASIDWKELQPSEPNYFFVPKNFDDIKEYEKGFKIDELFKKFSSGIETQKDYLAVKENKKELESILIDFTELSEEVLLKKYEIKEGRDWKVKTSKIDIQKNGIEKISPILYRPFDIRYSYLSGFSKGFVAYSRYEISRNLTFKDNIALLCCSRQTSSYFQHCFISNNPSERCTVSLQTGEVGYVFPLYLYSEKIEQLNLGQAAQAKRTPNLNTKIVNQIATKLGLTFTTEKETTIGTFAPIDILDYIYAVLHSPTYREKYKEFLKIDFPRVPYPKEMTSFKKMSSLGSQLREIHLLESPIVSTYITQYPIDGNNVVTKPHFIFLEASNPNPTHGRVYINDSQYFSGVPQVAWKFYIGGYQPAQKWLKDRKERTLGFDDILHYQKIIVALTETDRLMKEIDTLNSGNF